MIPIPIWLPWTTKKCVHCPIHCEPEQIVEFTIDLFSAVKVIGVVVAVVILFCVLRRMFKVEQPR